MLSLSITLQRVEIIYVIVYFKLDEHFRFIDFFLSGSCAISLKNYQDREEARTIKDITIFTPLMACYTNVKQIRRPYVTFTWTLCKCSPLYCYCIWFFNMDQAQPTGEHRIYVQTCTCTNSSFGFFSSLFLIFFICFSIRLTQLILLQRRLFGPRYIGDDFFLGPRYIGDDFILGPIVLQGRNKKV